MSAEATAWAWRQELGGPAKVVLLALADHAHTDGSRCWPGIERLSKMAGFSRRTIEKHLHDLGERGMVVIESGQMLGQTNRYQLPLEEPVYTTPVSAAQAVWAAFADLIPVAVTANERGRWNKAIVQLRAAGVEPEEVPALCAAYRKMWPMMALTPMAICNNLSLIRRVPTSKIERAPVCEECGVVGHTADCSQNPRTGDDGAPDLTTLEETIEGRDST